MLQEITQRTYHVFEITRTAHGIFQKLRQSVVRRESPVLKPKVGKARITVCNILQSVTQKNPRRKTYVQAALFLHFSVDSPPVVLALHISITLYIHRQNFACRRN
jgi:hypothetical protein